MFVNLNHEGGHFIEPLNYVIACIAARFNRTTPFSHGIGCARQQLIFLACSYWVKYFLIIRIAASNVCDWFLRKTYRYMKQLRRITLEGNPLRSIRRLVQDCVQIAPNIYIFYNRKFSNLSKCNK